MEAETDAAGHSYRIPEPVFAEWSYYNIDYSRLSRLPLHPDCLCLGYDPLADRGQPSSTSAPCAECPEMVTECRRQLEKAGSFLHLKGSELEHDLRRYEGFLQMLASLDGDEQLVGLGQVEEAVGTLTAQVLALARFRKSNFTGFWRQLARAKAHCTLHFDALLEDLAASPLFAESTLETLQLFRISQLYCALQSAYSGSSGAGLGSADVYEPAAFPALGLWRGWVDPSYTAEVHRRICARMSVVCTPAAAVLPSGPGFSDGHADTDHIHGSQCIPPSPPQTHKSSSPASSISQTHPPKAPSIAEGCSVFTAYLDNSETMAKYRAGMSTDASARDSLSLWWPVNSCGASSAVHISHDVYSGPWFAAGHRRSELQLMPDHVIPFLQSELNLNRLAHFPHEPRQYRPGSPDTETESKVLRRERLRCAQKLQKQIIMEDLKPLLLVSEHRIEYYDPESPSVRVVLRRNVQTLHKPPSANMAWLKQAFEGQPQDPHKLKDGFDRDLAFDIVEVDLGPNNAQMPSWLAHLFFDSALVHPVLDFDVYLHGAAESCAHRVEELPYWIVDSQRKSFVYSQQRHVEISMDMQSPSETTLLLPRSPALTVCARIRQHSHGYSLRYCLTMALFIATVLSIAFTAWPSHDRILGFVLELADLIVQWISRLLHFTV
ncbi:hypothetical protein GGF40_003472 [Coemansia sp. RSA 1286]|nr:hypothetical protein GGF40_003472 [Coemansia sp. RSA 1286]